MATVVDALVVTLGIEPKSIDKDLESLKGKITGGLKSLASAMAAPIASAFAGLSAGNLTSTYMEQVTGLKQLSDSLHMSMEDLQGWQYAAEAAGAEADEVGNFFRDMSDYIVDATTFDSGPIKDVAAQLGISLKDAQGNVRATTDIVLDLADAFNAADPQKAVAFGMQMSLDPGMIQMLQKGRGEIEGLMRAQKELGGYTSEDAELVMEARTAFMQLTRAVQSAAAPIARVLVPIMKVAAAGLKDIVAFLNRHKPFATAVFSAIALIITSTPIPASQKLMMVWLGNPLTWILAGIAAAIVGIGIVVDDLITYMQGGKSLFADFWSVFGTGEELTKSLGAAWEDLKTIASVLWADLVDGVNWFFDTFGGVFTGLGGVIRGALEVVKGIFTGDFQEIYNGIKDIFDGMGEMVKSIFFGVVDTVSNTFKNVASKIGAWFLDSLKNIPALGWILKKIGAIDDEDAFNKQLEQTKTENAEPDASKPLTPTTADSGNLAATQAGAEMRPTEINTNAQTNATVNVYANDPQNGKAVGNDVAGAIRKQNEKTLAMATQSGVQRK